MKKTDRRVAKTRNAIFEALLALMQEKRFEAITMQAVAERADVNRGTIYLHFTDKYDLLDKLVAEKLAALMQIFELQFQKNGSCVEDYTPIFRYFQENFAFYALLLSDRGAAFFRVRLHETILKITTEQNRGIRPEGLRVALVNEMVASGFTGLIEWWIKSGMAYPPEEMARQMALFFSYTFGSR